MNSIWIYVTLALLMGLSSTAAAEISLVEDWSKRVFGATGIPAGWSKYETAGGRPAYDFTLVEDEGYRALRLRSHMDHSTITKEIRVSLRATPILEWRWKVLKLPAGADIRKKETSDLTGHIFVIWPRFPAMLRSRLIGYVWDSAAPAQTVEKSRKTSTVIFFVLRSGPNDIGQWLTERRNVYEDYRRAFGEDPQDPPAIALSIDTNDTRSEAEALIGRIVFKSGPVAAPANR
jgi:hypothetical protein